MRALKRTVRPARAHRRGERLGPVAVARRLLAPARDDEERVVDREAEAETGDEVEREDREGVHLDRDPEAEERERDRAGADERRQERRHEPAEDPEREQEDEREGDQLGAAEVALDRLGHLARGDRAAAEAHLRIVGERRREPVRGVLRRIASARAEEDEHDAVVVDDRARDGGIAIDPGPHPRDGRRAARDEREHAGVGLDARPLLDLEVREPALGGEVGELGRAGIHARDDRAADRERHRDDAGRDERDRAGAGRDQVEHAH